MGETENASGQLNYEKRPNYSNKVLIGTWCEERQRYVQQTHKHVSKYSTDYYEKEPSFLHPNVIWNHRIKAEGNGPRILLDHEGDKYHNNFSTSFDIAFNFIPRIKQKTGLRRYSNITHSFTPEQDYTINYGNTINYGLRAHKAKQWDDDRIDPPRTLRTETQDKYRKHDINNYTYIRRATPLYLSSKQLKSNLQNVHVSMRNKQLNIMPDFPVKIPKRHSLC